MLPTSYCLSPPPQIPDRMPNAAGGSSDVWKVDNQDGTASALKVLRVTLQDDFKMIKKV